MSIGRLLRELYWYLRELSGESYYEHYVARQHELHPGQLMMTLSEFQRWRYERAENQPETRCC
ncbi:MAG: YbdD/YjiX family protein [Pseudonocardiaceae bacterium]